MGFGSPLPFDTILNKLFDDRFQTMQSFHIFKVPRYKLCNGLNLNDEYITVSPLHLWIHSFPKATPTETAINFLALAHLRILSHFFPTFLFLFSNLAASSNLCAGIWQMSFLDELDTANFASSKRHSSVSSNLHTTSLPLNRALCMTNLSHKGCPHITRWELKSPFPFHPSFRELQNLYFHIQSMASASAQLLLEEALLSFFAWSVHQFICFSLLNLLHLFLLNSMWRMFIPLLVSLYCLHIFSGS